MCGLTKSECQVRKNSSKNSSSRDNESSTDVLKLGTNNHNGVNGPQVVKTASLTLDALNKLDSMGDFDLLSLTSKDAGVNKQIDTTATVTGSAGGGGGIGELSLSLLTTENQLVTPW